MTDNPNTTPLPEDITEAIAISNSKAVGEQPAILANLMLANLITNINTMQQMAISNQQAMNQIQMATAAQSVSLLIGTNPNEAMAMKELLTNVQNHTQEIANLNTIIESLSPKSS